MQLFARYGTFRGLMASPLGPVVLAVAAVGAYYLWRAHQAHVVDALPYLLLGGCMLMHLFMHRGHGHGGEGHSHGNHNAMTSPPDNTHGTGSEDSRRP